MLRYDSHPSHAGFDQILDYIKYLKPKKIYAFEPQKGISYILKKRFKKKVKVFDLAIGKKNSYNLIYINKLKKTSTLNSNIIYSNSIFNKFKNLLLLQKWIAHMEFSQLDRDCKADGQEYALYNMQPWLKSN